MSEIRYINHYPKNGTFISVILDKKIVGSICDVPNGFRYYPEGHSDKFAGEVYKTIKEIKNSLEEE